jgi:SlyX protein
MNDDKRLEDIEIKLAHLEQAVQQISDVVAQQQQQLEAATLRAQRLAGRLEELEGSGASATAFEKPPHY